ncbi:MAG: trypsin-like peptidase domain-containing protein [Syntrophomonas sp.]
MNRQIPRLLIVAILSFILGGRLLASPVPLSNNTMNSQVNYSTTSSISSTGSIADIVDASGPAVVYIEVTQSSGGSRLQPGFWDWYSPGPQQEQKGTGTGFIIDANGYILTNQHVIDGASKINIKLQNQNQSYSARVIGQDHDLDLALLKIDTTDLPVISLGDSDAMRIGDSVIAIGNPYGLDHTVTTGVVSAKGRPITLSDRSYRNLIQTDAAINPGNSGGPLINTQGQVIAINTAVSTSAQGIGFAIPINTAKSIIQDLMDDGKVTRAYLGVGMTDITDESASQMNIAPSAQGVIINQVVSGSPAAKAGVKAGDILTSIDGKEMGSASKVQEYIQSLPVGQSISIGIIRNGLPLNITAVLTEKP